MDSKDRLIGKWAAPPKWKEVEILKETNEIEVVSMDKPKQTYTLLWSNRDSTWEEESFLWWQKQFNWLNGFQKLNIDNKENWIAWWKPPNWK